jgi:hypothetical protein
VSDEHRKYVARLRAQIAPAELARVNKRLAGKRRRKAGKGIAKRVAAVAGVGLGGALLASFFRRPAAASSKGSR